MKPKLKTLTTVPLVFLLAACVSPTEDIAERLNGGHISYDHAKKASEKGADVKSITGYYAFIPKATWQGRWDLVELFARNGASCFGITSWEDDQRRFLAKFRETCFGMTSPWKDDATSFSLFKFATGNGSHLSNGRYLSNEDRCRLVDLCLERAVADANERSVAEKQLREYVQKVNQGDFDKDSIERTLVAKIWDAGFAREEIAVWEKIQEEREKALTKARAEAEAKRIAQGKADAKKRAKARAERIFREKVAAKKRMKAKAKFDALYDSWLVKQMIESNLDSFIKELGHENNFLIESFGRQNLPQLLAKLKEKEQAVKEAKTAVDELAKELKADFKTSNKNLFQKLETSKKKAKEFERRKEMLDGAEALRVLTSYDNDDAMEAMNDRQAELIVRAWAQSNGGLAYPDDPSWMLKNLGTTNLKEGAITIAKHQRKLNKEHETEASILLRPSFGDEDAEEERVATANRVKYGNNEEAYQSSYTERDYEELAQMSSKRDSQYASIFSGATPEHIRVANIISMGHFDEDTIASMLAPFSPDEQSDIVAMAIAQRDGGARSLPSFKSIPQLEEKLEARLKSLNEEIKKLEKEVETAPDGYTKNSTYIVLNNRFRDSVTYYHALRFFIEDCYAQLTAGLITTEELPLIDETAKFF